MFIVFNYYLDRSFKWIYLIIEKKSNLFSSSLHENHFHHFDHQNKISWFHQKNSEINSKNNNDSNRLS